MKRKLLTLILSVLALLAGCVIYFESQQVGSEETVFTSSVANVFFKDNFHSVADGKFYRSAEMSSDRLTERIAENHIRTVIDLRLGQEDAAEATQLEEETTKKSGATYVHFPLRGSRTLPREKLEKLLEVLDHAETPILVHCSSGTHRSGLVSAIWLVEKEGVPVDVAAEQLSPAFGFFRSERALKSFIQGHPTIDNVFWSYQERARLHPITFREWVESLT